MSSTTDGLFRFKHKHDLGLENIVFEVKMTNSLRLVDICHHGCNKKHLEKVRERS